MRVPDAVGDTDVRTGRNGGSGGSGVGEGRGDGERPRGAGGSDERLAGLVEAAVAAKWAGHGIGTVNFIRPRRSMSQIGG